MRTEYLGWDANGMDGVRTEILGLLRMESQGPTTHNEASINELDGGFEHGVPKAERDGVPRLDKNKV